MHELSIASSIAETAERYARGRRVVAVYLKVGALRQVVGSSLVFMFGAVTRETLCEGAELELEPVAALMRCGSCGCEWDPAPAPAHDAAELVALPRFRCPDCDAAGAEVVAGDELLIEAIDVEDGATVAAPA